MNNTKQPADRKSDIKMVPRRQFIKIAGSATIVMGVTSFIHSKDGVVIAAKVVASKSGLPVSGGYLLVDNKKCQGCVSCMLACSLVNEGVENLSLARIQIIQNSFSKWPDDITIEQCRQCVDPACVKNCPENALEVDKRFGNVRRVVKVEKCIGCESCVEACPFTPSRPVVAPDRNYDGDEKSRICDLCAGATFHWDPKGGGPKGKQACVETCPVSAIRFTSEVPVQKGDDGYYVNLRDVNWKSLGYPMD